jgi:hypothetical protein
MTKLTHSEMHLEHKQWESEFNIWLEEIKDWHTQYQNALNDLKQIEKIMENPSAKRIQKAIEDRGKALELHKKLIELYQEGIKLQEKRIVEHMNMSADEEYISHDKLVNSHLDYRKKQAIQREVHERIKNDYHEIMAELARLKKEIEGSL